MRQLLGADLLGLPEDLQGGCDSPAVSFWGEGGAKLAFFRENFAIFRGFVLCCIKTKFYKKMCV